MRLAHIPMLRFALAALFLVASTLAAPHVHPARAEAPAVPHATHAHLDRGAPHPHHPAPVDRCGDCLACLMQCCIGVPALASDVVVYGNEAGRVPLPALTTAPDEVEPPRIDRPPRLLS